jgi:hypothetical protein
MLEGQKGWLTRGKMQHSDLVSVHGSAFTGEKKNVTMKIERFEDIEAWRLGRKLARKALKMS